METRKAQIVEVKRRFEETRQAVPATEVEVDVVVGKAAVEGAGVTAGGLGDGVEGDGGFGGIEVLGGLVGEGEGEAIAADALSSLSGSQMEEASEGLGASIGGGPAAPITQTEEEIIEKEAEPEQPPLSKTNSKKRGRPRKSVMVAKHLYVKRLTEEQEIDL